MEVFFSLWYEALVTVARLIKTKVETGNFDVFTVRNWLGHEKITTTEGYIRYTEQYYQQLPEDWISFDS